MLVLECNFHVGFKQVPTNVRMTRGKIEGGGFPFKSFFFVEMRALYGSQTYKVL